MNEILTEQCITLISADLLTEEDKEIQQKSVRRIRELLCMWRDCYRKYLRWGINNTKAEAAYIEREYLECANALKRMRAIK